MYKSSYPPEKIKLKLRIWITLLYHPYIKYQVFISKEMKDFMGHGYILFF